MAATTDALPDDPGTLKAMLLAERARAERLEQIIKELQRHRFGRRAEKLPEDQMLLGLEEVEQTVASAEEDAGRADPSARSIRAVACSRSTSQTISLATIGSYMGEISEPASTPESTRTPGPAGSVSTRSCRMAD